MSIVKCRNRTGVVYVYESECYFDEASQKYRYKRHCIGRLDPESGEVVPNGPRGGYRGRKSTEGGGGTSKRQVSEDYLEISNQLKEARARILEQDKQIIQLKKERDEAVVKLNRLVRGMEGLLSSAR